MIKLALSLFLTSLLVLSCAGTSVTETPVQVPIQHELKITIEQTGSGAANLAIDTGEEVIMKSMEVQNPGLELSPLSSIEDGQIYIKIFSGLSIADVTRFWSDMLYLEKAVERGQAEKIVNLFIDSPGGDAFSGLALADQIEKMRMRGYTFIAHATGIVASAAVPVFAVCDETHATEATIFMVHEAALWKWPGRETASDIRTQGKLMDLLQRLYLTKLMRNSNLPWSEWVLMEKLTSWFDVVRAQEIGILDIVDNLHPEVVYDIKID